MKSKKITAAKELLNPSEFLEFAATSAWYVSLDVWAQYGSCGS